MAMTKKEKEALHKAELMAALRWSSHVEADLRPPLDRGYSEGWAYNSHAMRVEQAWSSVVSHGIGKAPSANDKYRCASQGSRWLFSTKAKAIAAMRHDLEEMAAEQLLKCDWMMEAELNNANPTQPKKEVA